MAREEDVVHALVQMADTLVDDYDVIDVLTLLTDRSVTVLGISEAGVMLALPQNELRVVASSSEAMRVLELFELQAQEGPCLDSFQTGEQVSHEDLRETTSRWPAFSPAALDAGFQSVFAVPLRVRETIIGSLNLFSVHQARMDDRDLIVARAFADLATISVLQHRASSEAQRLNEQLAGALTSRVIIEQAKGVIAERAGVDMTQAFMRLRRYARNHNVLLTEVAKAAVDGTLDQMAWAPEARPGR